MKTAVFIASFLASLAVAQPHGHGHGHGHQHRRKDHGHQNKRGLVVTWVTETVYETVTAIVDDSTTELIMPSTTEATTSTTSTTSTTVTPSPGVFIEDPKTSSSAPPPVPSPAPPVVESPPPPPPVVQSPPPPPPPPPKPTTTSSAPPVETGGGGGGPSYSGDITYFALGLGACGFDDGGKDQTHNIVAVSAQLMGAQSNGNPMCGKSITIKAAGKTIQAMVHDKCPSCAVGDIDGSEKMFLELFGSLDAGRQKIEWSFNN
ncbi:RlpA-like double-psi beta-barrel-protein domain-containing protein-containing protein [Chaetomidium leptoderma]|uniref:RlpA-like double-psi beta-barrel-protein domain-containing protein-containing protein n=1 Tax=Chaetomidium leptoderma TaxID=669021 RepID=A0AAN6VJ63_9PEZI|nr:RlpA-like double-psi beta-barrel-protein domain-containing protein-containing protein [Chaetomidium leptoderma]